jgi:hypothetical protein
VATVRTVPTSQDQPALPVSIDNARILIARALEVGRIQITEHFRQRARERKFTSMDAERVLKTGNIVGSPRYCPVYENWCFSVIGISGSRTLEVRVGIDFNLDLEFPVMALITGISKGEKWRGKLKPGLRL